MVVFHNDDYTTKDFVVHVLMKFFQLSVTEATHIMLSVHHKGFGVAGRSAETSPRPKPCRFASTPRNIRCRSK